MSSQIGRYGLAFLLILGCSEPSGVSTSTAISTELPRTATDREPERRVDIYNAYWYHSSPSTSARLVAVDAQIVRGTEPWSLRDLELKDGVSNGTVATNPQIAFLNADGSFYSWDTSTDDKGLTGRDRVLLIFETQEPLESVKLAIGGEELTKFPRRVDQSGPVLPPRAAAQLHAAADAARHWPGSRAAWSSVNLSGHGFGTRNGPRS